MSANKTNKLVIRRKLQVRAMIRRRGRMLRNLGYRLKARIWQRAKKSKAAAAASAGPGSPANEHNYAAPADAYSRQMQNAFEVLRFAFDLAGVNGTDHWPKEWHMALVLIHNSAPAAAGPAMVDGHTQTDEPNPEDQPDDAFEFAQNASLWEISRNHGMSMLFFRAYIHGLTYGSRTHTLPHEYYEVPDTQRWRRLLPLIEKILKPTASTQYYVIKRQNTAARSSRVSKRPIRPRLVLDM